MQANRSLGNIFFMPKDYLVFLRNFISFKTASFYIGKSVAIFHPTESRIFFESSILHCVKSVRIRSYSGPHFPVFGLNTKRYSVSLHIQSKYGKIQTRITPNTDTFCAVIPVNCFCKQTSSDV